MKSTDDPTLIRFMRPVNCHGLSYPPGRSIVIVPSEEPGLMLLENISWHEVKGEDPSDEQIAEMERRYGVR